MENIIIKNCTQNKNIDDAIHELNIKYAYYVVDYKEYNIVFNAIENYYKGLKSC